MTEVWQTYDRSMTEKKVTYVSLIVLGEGYVGAEKCWTSMEWKKRVVGKVKLGNGVGELNGYSKEKSEWST